MTITNAEKAGLRSKAAFPMVLYADDSGFWLEYVPSIKFWRLQYQNGGCRPATDCEIAMWRRLQKIEARKSQGRKATDA